MGVVVANAELSQEFVDQQKQRLMGLKAELEEMREGLAEDQEDRAEEEEDFTQHDSGDMSHSLHTRQVDATAEAQVGRRLEHVERALQKIEEDTYGVCDDTGEPIPQGRLEAMPEAIRTVEAQQRHQDAYRNRGQI